MAANKARVMRLHFAIYLATTWWVREFREHGAAEFIYTFRDSTQFRVQARMQHDQLELELQRLAV
jgi:Tfp pilus assembly ATPase PilU